MSLFIAQTDDKRKFLRDRDGRISVFETQQDAIDALVETLTSGNILEYPPPTPPAIVTRKAA